MTQMTAMQARTTVGWHVEMEFQEDDHRTRAAALLQTLREEVAAALGV